MTEQSIQDISLQFSPGKSADLALLSLAVLPFPPAFLVVAELDCDRGDCRPLPLGDAGMLCCAKANADADGWAAVLVRSEAIPSHHDGHRPSSAASSSWVVSRGCATSYASLRRGSMGAATKSYKPANVSFPVRLDLLSNYHVVIVHVISSM